jgi:hypothetical protein
MRTYHGGGEIDVPSQPFDAAAHAALGARTTDARYFTALHGGDSSDAREARGSARAEEPSRSANENATPPRAP